MKRDSGRILVYGVVGLFFFVLDRVTKHAVLFLCSYAYHINRYLSCEVAYNRGISWSLFQCDSRISFVLITVFIAVLTLVVAWYAVMRFRKGHLITGEVMVVAGSLSNSIDRIMYYGVLDFIDISYNGWHWPLFNVADISIVVGVILMIFEHSRR